MQRFVLFREHWSERGQKKSITLQIGMQCCMERSVQHSVQRGVVQLTHLAAHRKQTSLQQMVCCKSKLHIQNASVIDSN
jgi:hypothetical protein